VRLKTQGSFQLLRTSHPGRFTRENHLVYAVSPYLNYASECIEGRLPAPIKQRELGVVAYAGLDAFFSILGFLRLEALAV